MCFEGSYGTFYSIVAVHTGRSQLEAMSPLLGDKKFVSCAGFIINDLEVYPMASLFDYFHCAVGGDHTMTVAEQLKRSDNNCV